VAFSGLPFNVLAEVFRLELAALADEDKAQTTVVDFLHQGLGSDAELLRGLALAD
jgi:hypothetical protein